MEEYIGIPYIINGRDKNGLDCYGLVYLIEKEYFHKDLPEFSNISLGNDSEILIAENKPLLEATKVDKPKDGDIVLLFIQGTPSHVGVYFDNGILHSTQGRGVVYEKINSPHLKRFGTKEYYRV